MQAAVIESPGQVHIANLPDPAPGPGEIIVRVRACGICGTDLHMVDGDFPAMVFPLVPGHEFAGEVVAVGSGTAEIEVGARVAIDPALACGHCEFCLRGRRNLCVERGAIGGTADGGFAEFVVAPYANAYAIPDSLSFAEAALIEPVSCVVHGMHVLGPRLGDSFLIFGAGTTGLMFVQLALRGGASKVAVVNRSERRLPLAARLGASLTTTELQDALEAEPLGYDCVVDATGAPAIMEAALSAVKPGGKLLLFGVAPANAMMAISPYRVYREEITLLGSMGIHYAFGAARDLIVGGAIDAQAMLTHGLELPDFPDALQLARDGAGVKVQIVTD